MTLEEGIYTLKITDSFGNSVSRADSYAGLQETPRVETGKVRYYRQAGGSYTFHWPAVNAAYSYFYRLWIMDGAGQTTLLHESLESERDRNRAGSVSDRTPATMPTAIASRPLTAMSLDLIFNRSLTTAVPFTANAGNVERAGERRSDL